MTQLAFFQFNIEYSLFCWWDAARPGRRRGGPRPARRVRQRRRRAAARARSSCGAGAPSALLGQDGVEPLLDRLGAARARLEAEHLVVGVLGQVLEQRAVQQADVDESLAGLRPDQQALDEGLRVDAVPARRRAPA